MATYGEIKQYVRDITHRTDLTDDQLQVWTGVVSTRINDELDARATVNRINVTPSTNPFGVAELLGSGRLLAAYKIIEVSYESAAGRRRLAPTSRERLTDWLRTTGDPQVYVIEGYQLYIAPFVSQEYRVVAKIDVNRLSLDTDSNVISGLHPQLYYHGLLMQAYEYLRDFEAADRYRLLFEAGMQRVNDTAARAQAASNTQASGASAWV